MKTATTMLALMIFGISASAEAQQYRTCSPVELSASRATTLSPYAISTQSLRPVATAQYHQPAYGQPAYSQSVQPIASYTTQRPIARTAYYTESGNCCTPQPTCCPTDYSTSYAPAAYPTASPAYAAPGANYVTGYGILGQPKLYVTGQPLRNLVRYITP